MLARNWRRYTSALAIMLLGFLATLSPRIELATDVASLSLRQAVAQGVAGAQYKVWVHFQDRTREIADVEQALDRAEAALSPRAARRRAKMHPAGERLVDVRDLPLNPDLLARCLQTGARLQQQSRWLNAASYCGNAEQIAQLTHLVGVVSVTPVRSMRRAAVPTPVQRPRQRRKGPVGGDAKAATALDYGTNLAAMQQANVVAAHEVGLSGHGILIGMLDTGFRTTHDALRHIPVLAEWDFVNDDGIVDNEVDDPSSSNRHGTMTLSTVAGKDEGQHVAPAFGASVVLAKTEDVSQEVIQEEDDWVAGLEWAEALGADIISSSLGYVDWYVFADLDGETAITTIAADLAAARGLIVVNSAGNSRNTTGYLIAPADADSIITVGAVDDTGGTASFSSPGPTADGRIKPDVAALGVGNTVSDPDDDTNYFNVSGTSFSCPLTSGVVALMLERVPGLTPLQVLDALRSTGSQSATPDNDRGWGIIDAMAAVNWFGPVISHTLLPDTADPAGPYPVTAVITDRLGLDTNSLTMSYQINGGTWQNVPMIATGQPDQYTADIPGQALQTDVHYFLAAASINALVSSMPYAGEVEPAYFVVAAPSQVGDEGLPKLTSLLANVPNPFNPLTEISFVLQAAGPTRLQIFDLRGQLVRTLLDEHLPAGAHDERWDGRDHRGQSVSSGTYFYRLSSAGEVRQRKMQLVR